MTEPEIEATRLASGDCKPAVGPGTDYYTERWAKGEYIDGGVSGVVELLPNGYVVKSPWNGWWEEEECREDMAREARCIPKAPRLFRRSQAVHQIHIVRPSRLLDHHGIHGQRDASDIHRGVR